MLPEEERTRLAPELARVPLPYKQYLQEPERKLDHAWFPHSGVLSMIAEMEDGTIVEHATIGREGLLGVPLALGSDRSAQAVLCQLPGEADRLPAEVFVRLLGQLPTLRGLVLRYALTLLTQAAQGNACNRAHSVETRCARWLLMTHDRVDGDTFPLTQEFLAQMLGVSRPSVSIAAGMLQRAGLIAYTRGSITVLDRAGLERASCECYGIVTREFRRVLGRGH